MAGLIPDLDACAAAAVRLGLTPRAAAQRYGLPRDAIREAMLRYTYRAKLLAGLDEAVPRG